MNLIMNLLTAAVLSGGLLSSHYLAKPIQHIDLKTEVQRLSSAAPHLNKQVLTMALAAYKKASASGQVKNHKLTVIDYSLPSSKERMWVFDLENKRLLFNTHVAHGVKSGLDIPRFFSNDSSSHATSLGTYVTKDIYMGNNGYSLNLKGLEQGFNDHAYERRVVIHGAWYMSPDFIKKSGRAGRSWGCPAIAATLARPVINAIKNGSVVFAFYPDKNYLRHSSYAVA
ncbi:MAG: murein L,D-transpeptidase catalytic domain family protein [Gammaproteobacteria bacterium]|nr:murein L,D-transpeptidase catalytic domain family protein [Gammaproteobacteria bacterium]